MRIKGQKVLVTGAGGFLGSHVCEALVRAGADVTAMVRYSSRADWGNLEFLPAEEKAALKVVPGNIEDGDLVSRHVKGKDVVFHLAALIAIPYSYEAPLSYVRTNVEGTLNIAEAARRSGSTRVVHTSTSETYGTACYTPIDEAHPLKGQSPYSASKIGADKLIESYHLSFGLPVVTVRPFNVFGPRQSARAIIPTVISQALVDDEVRLGALDPVRDLTFAVDTARAFVLAAECDAALGETINVGSGKGISIGALAEKILPLVGVGKTVVQDPARLRPKASEVFQLICDNRKAQELLGWAPQVSLEDGLGKTIEFIKANQGLYRPGTYTR